MNPGYNEIDVVILCGGKGTRLQPLISDRPKGLAEFGDETFLDILIDSLKSSGFKKFILCVGYMGDQIKNHFKSHTGLTFIFSEEEKQLGTGGALKNAQSLIQSRTFMVMNGDSICSINFEDFYNFHTNKNSILSIALVKAKETKDFGNVSLNELDEITGFIEKDTTQSTGLINAGIYLMQKEIFQTMPDTDRFSLENDLFPKLAGDRCAGYLTNGELIDIGTPERYEKAVHLIGGHK